MNNSKSSHVKETGINQEGKLLQQFLQLIPDLWCVITKDGYYQKLNGYYWKNLLGWDESELVAKPMLAFVHPEDVEVTSKALSKLEKNQIVEINLRHQHKDESYRWISWRINKSADELICGIGKEIIVDQLPEKLDYQSYLASDKSTYELIDSVSQKVELIKNKLQKTQQKLDFIKSEYKQNSTTVINQNSVSAR
ncbi:signal transduction histidine kinase [Calothrix parasitica NIES-267]|uniref:Signal transduction histidine kinase n=1 Tax=Calothrix parasitica NIES-267 TaxID=1973488 RepID=A0A1Z4LV69_9CYAN|nr:signal transduction histidine kinase [Calothrix parasitica NIES-267]